MLEKNILFFAMSAMLTKEVLNRRLATEIYDPEKNREWNLCQWKFLLHFSHRSALWLCENPEDCSHVGRRKKKNILSLIPIYRGIIIKIFSIYPQWSLPTHIHFSGSIDDSFYSFIDKISFLTLSVAHYMNFYGVNFMAF